METTTDRIRKAGFRATRPRIRVFSFLEKVTRPISIQEIVHAFRGAIDTVTIYRIVESFKKTGLVRQIDLHKGTPLFELADTDHHHIVCTSCSRIEDFTGCHIETLTERALAKSKQFAQVTSHSLELFGLCKRCVV